MRNKHLTADWQVARPFLAFWLGFAVLSILVAGVAPFITTVPSRWAFLSVGLGYCAVLSFLTIGICLLPTHIRERVLVGLHVLPLLGILSLLSIFLAIWSGRADALDYVFPVIQWALKAGGCVLLALATYGWCYRITRDQAKVAGHVAADEHVP